LGGLLGRAVDADDFAGLLVVLNGLGLVAEGLGYELEAQFEFGALGLLVLGGC
jgi:hypothetical protein